MNITPRHLNRATLDRQMLLRRECLDLHEAVRRLGLLQAQEPATPYIALWNRLEPFEPEQLDTAFADGSVVKSSLIRITLHALHADDYSTVYTAMLPSLRASRLGDRRFMESGLTSEEVDGLVPALVEFLERPHTSKEIDGFLSERLGEVNSRAWWALRTFAPLHRAPTGGPWSFHANQTAYVAAQATAQPPTHEEAVRKLFIRYLGAFGPASLRDFEQFTLLRRPVVKAAVQDLARELVTLEGPDGVTLFDVRGGRLPPDDLDVPPRLLPMWDNILLAYADRSRVIPEEYRGLVIRRNGNVLPTLLVDGYVAGVWRPVEGGIEASAFHELGEETWNGLAAEAAELVGFLTGREPGVYGNYSNWWRDLPVHTVRRLPS